MQRDRHTDSCCGVPGLFRLGRDAPAAARGWSPGGSSTRTATGADTNPGPSPGDDRVASRPADDVHQRALARSGITGPTAVPVRPPVAGRSEPPAGEDYRPFSVNRGRLVRAHSAADVRSCT